MLPFFLSDFFCLEMFPTSGFEFDYYSIGWLFFFMHIMEKIFCCKSFMFIDCELNCKSKLHWICKKAKFPAFEVIPLCIDLSFICMITTIKIAFRSILEYIWRSANKIENGIVYSILLNKYFTITMEFTQEHWWYLFCIR